MKSERYKKERQKEWDVMKKLKRERMKPEDEGLFKEWARCEFQRRQKVDKIKRQQEVQKMRQQYVADGVEEFFEIK